MFCCWTWYDSFFFSFFTLFIFRDLMLKRFQTNNHHWVAVLKMSPQIIVNHAHLRVFLQIQFLRLRGACHCILLCVQRYCFISPSMHAFMFCNTCSVIWLKILHIDALWWQKHSLFRQIFVIYRSTSKAVKQVSVFGIWDLVNIVNYLLFCHWVISLIVCCRQYVAKFQY